MDNAGTYNFAASVTNAAIQVTTAITDLDGMLAATIEFQFLYGQGGASCDGYLQVSFDGGANYRDVAHAAFSTAPAIKTFNVSGLTPHIAPITPTDGALEADSAVDGMLGPVWRLKTVSTGTYGGSTQLVVRLTAR